MTEAGASPADIPPYRYTAALAGEIEPRWQDYWEERRHLPRAQPRRRAGRPDAPAAPARRSCTCYDMFPYPSGAGLHVGHPLGYIGTDVLTRYKRMTGLQRAAPDGLRRVRPAGRAVRGADRHPPADHHRGEHRAVPGAAAPAGPGATTTAARVATTDPDYYRWTQWIFLQIFNSWYDAEAAAGPPDRRAGRRVRGGHPARRRTAGRGPSCPRSSVARSSTRTGWPTSREAPVNWCPGLGTVLANEEVTADGRSERGNFPVFKRNLKQWMMRITAYARPPGRRPGRAGLAGAGQADAAQLDRPLHRRARRLPGRAAADADPGLHHPPGHAVRRHLHGAGAGARRWSTRWSPAAWPDGHQAAWTGGHATPAEAVAAYRARRGRARPRWSGTAEAQGQDRRLHRRVRDQPGQRRADPGLHRRLRAGRLRHRRDHGGARPGRAGLGVRRGLRAADHPDRAAARRLRRQAYTGDGSGDQQRPTGLAWTAWASPRPRPR